MKSIKNIKKVITILLAMLICSNVFAAERRPDQIDVKISNFHQDGSNVKFSLKFKKGLNYPFLDFNWANLSIYLDIYDTNGALNTAATTNDATSLATFGIYFSATAHTDNPGTRPANSVPLCISMSRLWDDPRGDVTDTYEIIANYTIPVTGTLNPDAYIIFRESTATLPDSPWSDLYSSGWSSAADSEARTGAFKSDKARYYLESSCPTQALWTGAIDNDWFDSDNWVNPIDQTAVGRPCATTDVYIPGTAARFPILKGAARFPGNNPNVCKDITFFQGGQVGRIDLLTYERARVQLNMYSPYYQSGYNSDFSGAFWNYSHHYSTPPLSNGQWHMISMPLKGIVSGDLAYGGYPMTVMRKFNVMKANSGRFTEGTWSTSFTETTEPFAAGEGFAFYAFGGGGDYSVGFPRDYYSWSQVPDHTGSYSQPYGLGTTNGIIEFPTYDKPDKLQSHRIQKYQGGVSTFYDVFTTGLDALIGTIDYDNTSNTKTRDSSTGTNSDYKFIGDRGLPVTSVSYPVARNWESNTDVLIGNPFMSALDFDAFYAVNGPGGSNFTMNTNSYRLWNGTQFVEYNCDTRTTSDGSTFTQYIAPMQAFFILNDEYRSQLNFDAATMSVASPAPVNLRSASGTEQNIIRLSVRNNENEITTNTMIGQLPNADASYRSGEDITKLFSSTQPIKEKVNDLNFSYIPEIYTSVGDVSLSMNYIGLSGANVPVGVRVPASGTSTLTLTGMNRYDAAKVELWDNNGQFIADLTGRDSFEYSFNNGEGGYQTGRFVLRIAESTTGLDTIEESNLVQVYKSGNAIQVVSSLGNPIKQIRISDIQGRVLYSNPDVNADVYRVEEQFEENQILVVQVVTEKNTESVKIKN